MITALLVLCKCAISFLPAKDFHRFANLSQHHFGNIAGSGAEDRNGFRGVEVPHMDKVLKADLVQRIKAAAYQKNIGDAGPERGFQPHLGIEVIQLFQKAVLLHPTQVCQIVGQIIVHHGFRKPCEKVGKGLVAVDGSEAVFQSLGYFRFIPFLQLPKGDITTGTAVGIGDVKHIAKSVRPIRVYQKGDALCASVDPSAQTVPGVDVRTGGGVGLLGMDEELLGEAVLVVIGHRMQKGGIILRRGHDLL